MPIHVRAEPGEYAEAVLLPGDPLRAKYIAETYLDDVVQRNSERGLLGLHRHLPGQAGLRAGNRHGLPGRDDRLRGARPARLQEADPRRHLRRPPAASCARRPDRRADRRAGRLDRDAPGRERAALPDRLVEPHPRRRHTAKEQGQELHVGPIVSSDVFYNPDEGQYERWSKRGVLAVEMEASALFTVAALRGVEAGCLLTVSDIVVEGEFTRISDDDLRAAVDRMTKIALDVAIVRLAPHHLPRQPGVRRSAPRASAGPSSPTAPSGLGLTGETLFSERPGHLIELARAGGRRRREPRRRRRRRRDPERGRQRHRPPRRRARDDPARHRHGLRPHLRHPDQVRRRRCRRPRRPTRARSTPASSATAPGAARTPSAGSRTSARSA